MTADRLRTRPPAKRKSDDGPRKCNARANRPGDLAAAVEESRKLCLTCDLAYFTRGEFSDCQQRHFGGEPAFSADRTRSSCRWPTRFGLILSLSPQARITSDSPPAGRQEPDHRAPAGGIPARNRLAGVLQVFQAAVELLFIRIAPATGAKRNEQRQAGNQK